MLKIVHKTFRYAVWSFILFFLSLSLSKLAATAAHAAEYNADSSVLCKNTKQISCAHSHSSNTTKEKKNNA